MLVPAGPSHRRRSPMTPFRNRQTDPLVAASWLAVGCLGTLVGLALMDRLGFGTREPDSRLIVEVQDLIERYYVHGSTQDELMDGALHGMLSDLDPYSRYYDRHESAAFEDETAGVYAGVGIRFARPSNWSEVLCALPDSPAERAGLQPGDRLLRVDGLVVAETAPEVLRESLSNTEMRAVPVELETRSGQRKTVELTPESVTDPTVRHAVLLEDTDAIGYLHIRSFSRRTSGEFDRAIENLQQQGMRGLVLDLRSNLGGVLDAALDIADRFLDDGVLLQVESRDGVEEYGAHTPETWLLDMPLVCLVDGESASASEVLAGALQDHRAAVLVGERTYGKGTVQTLTRVPATSGIIKLTTSLYRTPSGRRIERSLDTGRRHGLAPDVELALDTDQALEMHRFHAGYTPLPATAELIRELEREGGEELLPRPPRGPQLALALDLLSGRRPHLQAQHQPIGDREAPATQQR